MAGAGADCLPPCAPLGHGGLLIPVLPLCCEDPGWAQARRPSGRSWACVRKGVCVRSLGHCTSGLQTCPTCARHILLWGYPGHPRLQVAAPSIPTSDFTSPGLLRPGTDTGYQGDSCLATKPVNKETALASGAGSLWQLSRASSHQAEGAS